MHLGHYTQDDIWFDRNGHLNVTGYLQCFNLAVEKMFDKIGLGTGYMENEQRSFFAAQQQLTYLNEVHKGETLSVSFQLLGFDNKRLHKFYRLYNDTTGKEAATLEALALHIDMSARKTTDMSEACLDRFARIMDSHAAIPRHPATGRTFGLERPKKGDVA